MDWKTVDRWVMGEALTGSRIGEHLEMLCNNIGPRWSSSEGEQKAVTYIRDVMLEDGLDSAELEEYDIQTWSWSKAEARTIGEGREVDILPFNRCPAFESTGEIVDVGYGTPREIYAVRSRLPGSIPVMNLVFEPFTPPIHHAQRLMMLADAGAAAAFVIDRKDGRRMEYHSASDWRDPGLNEHPLPTVTTSREHGALLRARAGSGARLQAKVESEFYESFSANVGGEIRGSNWPEEHLVLGAHHDTVYGAPGGNDNASGTICVMETARVLAGLRAETGLSPGCSIRFVTFSAEEQKLQGSSAYVDRHYGPEDPPRLVVNLDELSTGPIKGIVLAFPHLRDLVQRELDSMGDGLRCHVMAQLDPSSDHFPFLRKGLQASHLWRWRFHGRHADADFHHEGGDTADKANVRELKEYAGQLARVLLRLSHIPPTEWPRDTITEKDVGERLEKERGSVIRVF